MANSNSFGSRFGRGMSTFADMWQRSREFQMLMAQREADRELDAGKLGQDAYQAAQEAQQRTIGDIRSDIPEAETQTELDLLQQRAVETTPAGTYVLPAGGAGMVPSFGLPVPPAGVTLEPQRGMHEAIGEKRADFKRQDLNAFAQAVETIATENPDWDADQIVDEATRQTGVEGPAAQTVSGTVDTPGAEVVSKPSGTTATAIERGKESAAQGQLEQAQALALDFLEKGEAAKSADDLRQVNSAHSVIADAVEKQATGDISGITDTAVVMAFAKALDPGGRVTDSDYQNVIRNLGMPAEITAEARRLFGMNESAFLTEAARQKMLDAVNAKVSDAQGAFEKYEDRFRRLAKRAGIDDEIINDLILGTVSDVEAAEEEGGEVDVTALEDAGWIKR